MKKIVWMAALWLTAGCSSPDREMDRYVDRLMAEMTLREKIGQLNLCNAGDIYTGPSQTSGTGEQIRRGEVGGVLSLKQMSKIRELQEMAVNESRLGIPLLFCMDVIHGYETIFPIPLGLSCSWDLEGIERSARIAAEEASARGIALTFSPMADISRDARWGRMAEGSGEDAYLGSRIAEAMVRGYQGDDLSAENTIMACVKHFAFYGAPDAGRDYNTVDMSRVRMYNEYLDPYRAAVDAGAGSAMASFNVVDGVPATGNRWLLTDLLRGRMGFDGLIMSDYTAIPEMEAHGMGSAEDCTALAMNAGLDWDMVSECYLDHLENLAAQGRVDVKRIDEACRHVLEAKYRLGLFEDPFRYWRDKSDPVYCRTHRDFARKLASESFVLLKNDGVLPLEKRGRIALIGPAADNRREMSGTWSLAATPDRYASLVEGMRRAAGDRAEILCARGCDFTAGSEAGFDEAVRTASRADVIVVAMGEGVWMNGEASCRSRLELPAVQRRLLERLLALKKPLAMLYFMGRPVVMEWEQEHVPAILSVWSPGSEGADAISDVLFGDVNPSGKLTVTFPRNEGQIPIHYDALPTGRPLPDERNTQKYLSRYLDVSNTPLYPFGYGLSYTRYDYANPILSAPEMEPGGEIEVSVDVTNAGERDGDEIVQLYIRDRAASISRPVRQLKDFRRVHIPAGETVRVSFTLPAERLGFYDGEMNYIVEPGWFDVMIGPNSRDVAKLEFELLAGK